MKRRRLALAIIALIVASATLLLILTRPLRRRLPFRVPRAPVQKLEPTKLTLVNLPQAQWTRRLIALEDAEQWEDFDDELTALARAEPLVFKQYELAYLHARVKQQLEDHDQATELLRPYIEPDHAFRDLALYHLAEISYEDDRADEAAGYRDELIFTHPRSIYWLEAVEEQLAYFAASKNLDRYSQFAGRLRPAAETTLRRQIDAYFVEMLVERGALAEAKERGIRLIRGEDRDDAAERALRALDRPEIIRGATAEELMLLGESAREHRHFDRAVALLTRARSGLTQKRDDITFAIGRSYFGNEQYEQAERVYLDGANGAKSAEAKATFFYHASRCAQLLGDDARAERQMTAAIAVPGKFPSTSASLTQRMRTRAQAKRYDAAASDLRLLKQLFPNAHSVVEASIALSTTWIASGRIPDAQRDLTAISSRSLERYDRPEIDYWQARGLEKSAPDQALTKYLELLRSTVPSHFAYLARQRLADAYKAEAAREVQRLRSEVQQALASKAYDRARKLQTDIVLLAPGEKRELEVLRGIYLQIPRYRDVLDLRSRTFPAFPLPPNASRGDLLFAMGLFDEAVDEIPKRYPLQPLDSALTAAYGYHLAGASRSSLRAIEILINNVPDDFLPELLPQLIRELLYPRYFYQFILEDSDEYEADPVLVLAIMREESRFNPRAKSVAAARGLLQFILTTALQIGRDLGISELAAEDLYDPRVVIQLGAKYVGDLLETFSLNEYQTAAAYNAGPNQARLWARLAPAAGNDFYLSAINFEETKLYVQKVMNSYRRYHEIYGTGPATGGLRAAP